MRFLTLFSLLLLLVACDNNATVQEEPTTISDIEVQMSDNPQWEKDNLRLLPIVASVEYLDDQQSVAQYKVLSEALENERFRVSEKKPFGRFDDAGAVNTLTVQNKTEDPIFLMAGEVVQGGNQDRVIGEDAVIAARSIEDVSVFCVEHGRWTYEGDKALNDGDRKIFAFRGYYNVASSQVRRSVAAGNQQAVWDQVDNIRTKYSIDSGTKAYADLETNDEFVSDRTNYERFFSDKLANNETIIGFVALSGDKILGADVFGHPTLLNRQFSSLLSSYATDALTLGNNKEMKSTSVEAFITDLQMDIARNEGFREDGKLVHYAKLP